MHHHDPNRRLVVIHNPNSTDARHVRHGVFDRLVEAGESFETIQTRYTTTQANTNDIAEQLRDGDTVISAAGDGTASQVANAVLQSGVDAEIGFLPYGNFNDLALTHMRPKDSVIDLLHADTAELQPLAVYLDGQLWRYAPGYLTIGWTAIAAGQFDDLTSRGALSAAPRSLKLIRSIAQLADSYAKHRNTHLPPFETTEYTHNDGRVTDILAINSPRVAHIVRSDRAFYDGPTFGYKEVDISKVLPNLAFGAQALAGHAALAPVSDVSIRFDSPAHGLPVQTEGEFARVNTQVVTISKWPERKLTVLHSRE